MNTQDSASGIPSVTPASVVDVSTGSRISITAATGLNGRSTPVSDAPSSTTTSPGGRMPPSTFLGDFVGSLLGRIARWLNPSFIERSLAFSRDTGQYAVLAGAALTLVYAIYGAIKFNSFAFFLTGLCFVAALAVAQFAAMRFLGAATRAIANTPSQISSPAFLECTGLLVLLFSLGTLIGGVVTSIQVSSMIPLLPALFISAVMMYVGAVSLHPQVVNVEAGINSAGEEAIGLLSFFYKTALKLTPLFFGLLAAAGSLAIVASFFEAGQSLAGVIGSVLQVIPLPVAIPSGFVGSAVVLLAALLPLASYFMFLLSYLVIDVLRAVLCVPGKLDALRR